MFHPGHTQLFHFQLEVESQLKLRHHSVGHARCGAAGRWKPQRPERPLQRWFAPPGAAFSFHWFLAQEGGHGEVGLVYGVRRFLLD